jgi:hypothetical protein
VQRAAYANEESCLGDERSDFGEGAAADSLAAHGESAALLVGQPKALPSELLLEDPVLLPEVVDDRVLLTRNPSGHGGYENLPWMEHGCHPPILVRSKPDRQLSTRRSAG